ncbi:response regulator [Zobellia galactanivorans]|uniref:response regulator n=1 Tax=Zobellia galactanivorans (strain DSM 12802 / CCUG 47099 / CIP 106680 / NCIMB 13871 / Dsij) TaxID=63186 RepID=UPI001C07BF39|nr:response regulator [Zobellia galactanivorans]MBU3025223.1 response regulator [Zobellia galactanivorans]MDO6810951.1 response regulator [Zobellia galactanivorans]
MTTLQNTTEKKWSIFLADDDLTDQEIFRDALAETNTPVSLRTFDNGVDLLTEFETGEALPDVIFLDLYMPKMDGSDCLLKIRENPLFDHVPIVLYSTEFDIDRIEELFEQGANRYLRKTSSFESLVSSLERTLSSLVRNALSGPALINIVV